ncbi:hypothetical protein BH24ACT19_BH24ACT19_08970 [soil metagenome]|jgi:hypothetical protein
MPRVRAFIDRALYLPEEEWATDEQRREEAGVPEEEEEFATKGGVWRGGRCSLSLTGQR